MPEKKTPAPVFSSRETIADDSLLSSTDATDLQRIAVPERQDPCIVVLTGRSVGRVIPLRTQLTVGRAGDTDIMLDDDGVSRVHAIFLSEGDQVFVKDLGSTNGTWVERDRIGNEKTLLKDGDRVRIGPATILRYGYQDTIEQQFLAQLYRSATRDALTGLYNRRWFNEQLTQEINWHRRHNEPLTLVLADLDHFKKVNDTQGHLGGDAVLAAVAASMRDSARSEDTVARIGGEEFAIIMRQTSASSGRAFAERLRAAIESTEIPHRERVLKVTTSIGVVTRSGQDLSDAETLTGDADAFLYLAKSQGRNRVVSEKKA